MNHMFKKKLYIQIRFISYKYPEISLLTNKSRQSVITSVKSVFASHGTPDEVVADNVPFASEECLQFARDWGFQITTSSPHYPQWNE